MCVCVPAYSPARSLARLSVRAPPPTMLHTHERDLRAHSAARTERAAHSARLYRAAFSRAGRSSARRAGRQSGKLKITRNTLAPRPPIRGDQSEPELCVSQSKLSWAAAPDGRPRPGCHLFGRSLA